jgi:predicted aspartyl protease
MRVKEIKEELERLKVPTADAFEKEELVKRLVEARQKSTASSEANSSDIFFSTTSPTVSPASSSDENVIVAPLYYTTVDAGRLASGVTLQSSDRPYATIQISVETGGDIFPLNLLLDTACSGFVLRPSVVERHKLPQMSTPVTMTGAGGTVAVTGLTQIEIFFVATTTSSSSSEAFGPMPAAVQDITGLPSALDGIIGLSFLNQFECVDMDFTNRTVALYQNDVSHDNDNASKVVGRAKMKYLSSLGLYTVDVYLGDRGPVKMLVDSGASHTLLNWKGVQDLGLSRDDKLLQRNLEAFGALGSDNVAMQLTHRVTVGSSFKIGSKSKNGVSLQENERNLRIDIGDIAILESLRGEGVGGLLGIDALMRCSRVRFHFQLSGSKEMVLYE